jgi:phosphatidylserine/phosphatidylglycerophosphate/cardiolipin synthase-like enzyme
LNCFQVTSIIQTQVMYWAMAIVSWVQQQCSNVSQQIKQWQQQWQNQCSSFQTQVCQSWPWPLNLLCSWVTSVVCMLVSVMIQVIETVWSVICSMITLVIMALVLAAMWLLLPFIWLMCVLIPCPEVFESPIPPDGGWAVTLGEAAPMFLSMDNEVELLVDGASACAAIAKAMGEAEVSVHVLQLEFDSSFEGVFPRFTTVQSDKQSGNLFSLLRGLADVSQAPKNLDVRILLNKNVLQDSVGDVTTALSGMPGNNVQVQGLHVLPEVMHGKVVIVDGKTVFFVGLPFNQGYWDTPAHPVSDMAHRGCGAGGNSSLLSANVLGDVGDGVGNKPVHTVSLRATGTAAFDAESTFAALWKAADPTETTLPVVAPHPGKGNQGVQLVRTLPPLRSIGLPHGEKGVLEAYLRAINNAQVFIYMEEQYLTYPVIREALVRALTANPALQLILLLNENPDQPTYKFWENGLLSDLSSAAASQVGMFSPWRTTSAGDSGQVEIMQCYVEAKACVVDDKWATIGSGNLDGASLGHIFELLPSPFSCVSGPLGWRNVELNAVVYDGIAGQEATGLVKSIRAALWEEQLGAGILPAVMPAGGWLPLWTATANANVASLNATQQMSGPAELASRILPYSQALEPSDQLMSIGVNVGPFNVAAAVPQSSPHCDC